MTQSEHYIGLMSGTSADALDAALIEFKEDKANVISTYSARIPVTTKKQIHNFAIPSDNEINKLRQLDREISLLSAKAVNKVCSAASISTKDIIAIGSHGQTIRHVPPTGKEAGYTLQAGDPNIITEITGITTVADFRRRDIAAGGHGAPLAPAFHNAVFRSNKEDRIILNLGGIANVTWIPVGGNVTGYDTGPANGLMDSWCQKHLGQSYDKNGNWAKSGANQPELLKSFLKHPFFALSPPKSTGREDFNLRWLEQELQNRTHKYKPEDIQATLLSLAVHSVTQAINLQDSKAQAAVYICGGGANNQTLIHELESQLSPRQVCTTKKLGIAPEWVECAAFAWLAKQTIHGKSGNLSSVTGAERDTVLGGIYSA